MQYTYLKTHNKYSLKPKCEARFFFPQICVQESKYHLINEALWHLPVTHQGHITSHIKTKYCVMFIGYIRSIIRIVFYFISASKKLY